MYDRLHDQAITAFCRYEIPSARQQSFEGRTERKATAGNGMAEQWSAMP
ncbi:hypothetical protein A3768_5127 (plasmid) [Ralstonia solanacearum]|nr:hypothetical protein A3768_5127 [Ralstonia solanacearum]